MRIGPDEFPPFAYDDLLTYAPSFLIWERSLVEGKALGTAKEVDLVFLDKDRTMDAILRPEKYAAERKVGADVGRKKLRAVQEAVEPVLNRYINYYLRDRIDEAELRRQIVTTMKKAWKEVFLAGVRASGIGGYGPGRNLVNLTAEDEVWVRGAMKHEMQFLNGMLDAIVEDTFIMPLRRRVKMYVDALESFYDSARVIGLPAASVISWVVPHKDRRICAGCKYLFDHSPYSKRTLPTVPRAGMTPCLTNCRDRLFVRIDQEQALRLHESSPTRGTHIKRLREIKRLGHL